jgi:endonuclease YncB( thermonuclease family)
MIPLLLAALVIPAGQSFACTPTKVYDGDGPVWCTEGPRLRLAGIAAREMDGTCRSNQPCPDASAIAARNALVRLLGTPLAVKRRHVVIRPAATLRCVSNGSGGHGRTGAWCYGPQGDISCAMVRSGTALVWKQYWKGHRCQ